MYARFAPFDPEGILQDEFLNSRGAIPRFGRGSIEIRVIDVQESPMADLALAALTIGALRLLTEESLSTLRQQQAMEVRELASVFLDCVREGEKAVVRDAAYLGALGMGKGATSAQEIWWHFLEGVDKAGFLPDKDQTRRLGTLLRRGTLARQILLALDLPGGRVGDPPPLVPRAWLQEVYRSLATCLTSGEIFVV